MKLSSIFKKNTAKKDSVVIKVDKKLLQKLVGGTEIALPKITPKLAKESHG